MLAVFARRAAKLPAKLPREMALIREPAVQRAIRQRLVGVDQGTARHAQANLPEIFLRSDMEAGQELPFKGSERHLR